MTPSILLITDKLEFVAIDGPLTGKSLCGAIVSGGMPAPDLEPLVNVAKLRMDTAMTEALRTDLADVVRRHREGTVGELGAEPKSKLDLAAKHLQRAIALIGEQLTHSIRRSDTLLIPTESSILSAAVKLLDRVDDRTHGVGEFGILSGDKHLI